ncbi:MAG: RHS repeat protein [Verrucomicrobia bacterium]|nr:RHS repeat protein [Verrucomicrobiota bacterium]
MKNFLLVCFLFISLAANRETCPIPPTTVTVEPWGLLAGCVDVATGTYVGSQVEVAVHCHEPIYLYRNLVSCGEGEKSTSFWQLGKEYLDFKAKKYAKGKDSRFRIIGEGGDIIEYLVSGPSDWGFQARGQPFLLHVDPEQQISNTSYGEIGGRTHPRNNSLHYDGYNGFTLRQGDGEIRKYIHGKKAWHRYHNWKKGQNKKPKQETFLLHEVIRPNGNRIFYTYDHHDELIEIRSANKEDTQTFGWIRIAHGKGEKIITTSDHQRVKVGTTTLSDPTHSKRKKELLHYIVHTDGMVEGFRYRQNKQHLEVDAHAFHRHPLLKFEYGDFDIPGQQHKKISYWDGTRDTVVEHFVLPHRALTKVSAPVGEKGAFEPLYSITPRLEIRYFGERPAGCISVQTINGAVMSYGFHQGRVCNFSLHSDEYFFRDWNKEGNLVASGLRKHDPSVHLTKTVEEKFTYDQCRNVIQRTLCGSLTGQGNGNETTNTTYTYSEDGFNLPLSEEKGSVRIVNEYRPGTDLLILRSIYENGELREEVFLDYDSNAALISKIHRIGSLTLIEEMKRRADGVLLEIVEKTPSRQLKRAIFHYNPRNQVIQTDHFDGSDHYLYSLFTEYDERWRVTFKTDPLGRKTLFTYNDRNELLTSRVEGTFQELHFEYDPMYRLTKKELHDSVSGESQVERYCFDKMSQQIAWVTPLDQTVLFKRDPQGRVVEESQAKVRTLEGWQSPKILRECDGLDRVVKETDPQGGVTEIAYTDRSDWYYKKYPDGTSEKRYFTLEGQLEEEIHKDESSTHYIRDYKGRILSQQRCAPSGEVLSQERFTYDGNLLLTHTDPLGFTTHYAYDDAGRLLSQRKEEALTEYTYDAAGRKVTELSWSDPHHYTLKRFEYDLLNRVIAEQLEDETGKIYQRQETTYDLSGNPTQVSTLLSTTTTTYDSFSRPIQKIDPLGQITTFSYKKVPFEGETVLLITSTDPLGRQTLLYQDGQKRPLRQEQRDEDGALLSQVDHYYDLNGHEVKQEHQVLFQGKVLRTYAFGNTFGPGHLLLQSTEGLTSELPRITRYLYDRCGRLACTIKPDGAHLYRTYDALSRLATHEGPDFSYSYTYNAADDLTCVNDVTRTYNPHHQLIKEVTPAGAITYQRDALGRRTRVNYLGQEVTYTYQGPYLAAISCQNLTHHYLEYDLEGRPTLEQLPGNCGDKKRTYDPLGRLTHLQTDHLAQTLTYDPVSNLTHLTTTTPDGTQEKHFSYDRLSQLSSEPQTHYSHDSLGNRLSHNQESYVYDAHNQRLDAPHDLCGRLLKAGPHSCRYDSLDRLTSLDDRHFTYDAFHRREDLLYDGQLELGNEEALRVVATNAAGDIGAMRFVILRGEVFIPLMDHLGSVVALLNPEGVVCESCEYSAFGVPSQDSCYENPWGFCSKRREGELLLFGRRYYHPSSGRWISPDPLGHADGPNLYAYCRNNPLGVIDPWGLSAKEVLGRAWDKTKDCGRKAWEKVKECGRTVGDFLSGGEWYKESPTLYDPELASYEDRFPERVNQSEKYYVKAGGDREFSCHFQIVYHNGIFSSQGKAWNQGNQLSLRLGGEPVHVLYTPGNNIHGPLDAEVHMYGKYTPVVHHHVQKYCEIAASMDPEGSIVVFAWSGGVAALHAVLKYLPSSVTDRMEIYAAGGPMPLERELAKNVTNYYVPNDPVTMLWREERDNHSKYNIERLEKAGWLSPGDMHAFDSKKYSPVFEALSARYIRHLEEAA